jgi:hypothetical protein
LGINLAIGTVTVVGASFVASLLPAADIVARLGLLVVLVVVLGVQTVDLAAMAGVCVIAFALLNGFLVNSGGGLSWHGAGDAWRLCALLVGGGFGYSIGWTRRRSVVHGRFAELQALANGTFSPEGRTGSLRL